MKVKICGITDTNEAIDLLTLPIDLIGLVFVKTSSRCVSVSQAMKLKQIFNNHFKTVAVFQNQPLDEVREIIDLVKPDDVQLHGQEDPSYCRALNIPIIKSIYLEDNVMKTEEILEKYENICSFFLVDRKVQGQGPIVDLNQVNELSHNYPLILSGGLSPKNISEILEKVGTSIIGVDVSSGVEDSPGHKNIYLIKEFIEKSKET